MRFKASETLLGIETLDGFTTGANDFFKSFKASETLLGIETGKGYSPVTNIV